jgi:hypothetical protein
MDKDNVLQALGQVQAEQAGNVFRQFLRGTARAILIEVMAEEVTRLCGVAYYPSKWEEIESLLVAVGPIQ